LSSEAVVWAVGGGVGLAEDAEAASNTIVCSLKESVY